MDFVPLMLLVIMLAALFAGHYAQRSFSMLREIRDELRRHRLGTSVTPPQPPAARQ